MIPLMIRAFLLIISAELVVGKSSIRYCEVDGDCYGSECCRSVPEGTTQRCVNMPSSEGDPCGGPYRCNTCANFLDCIMAQKDKPYGVCIDNFSAKMKDYIELPE